jgi:glycerophosphoryl diester phosphodiesterase
LSDCYVAARRERKWGTMKGVRPGEGTDEPLARPAVSSGPPARRAISTYLTPLSAALRVHRRHRKPHLPPDRPLVVAHRGASTTRAEHTLAAYQAALDSGVDGLECDVRLTRDGHLVCVHDRKVDRTSNGRGIVSELDLSRLETLDFDSWHAAGSRNAEWPKSADELVGDEPYLAGVAADRQEVGGGVLTLEGLLELVRGVGRPVRLLIETKHPTRYAGLVEKELVRTLHRYGLVPRSAAPIRSGVTVHVMSFAPTALRRIRLLAPDLPTVLLLDRLLPGRRGGELPSGTEITGPGLTLLRADPGFVNRARLRGHGVYVWTVDHPDDIEFVISLGVDAIITNDPVTALRIRDAPGN